MTRVGRMVMTPWSVVPVPLKKSKTPRAVGSAGVQEAALGANYQASFLKYFFLITRPQETEE